jgi:hypothetical protein
MVQKIKNMKLKTSLLYPTTLESGKIPIFCPARQHLPPFATAGSPLAPPPPPPHGAPQLLLLQATLAPTPDSALPPRDLGMEAAAEDTDGDRVIEIVSAGALYRGEEWERKYWSNSRVRPDFRSSFSLPISWIFSRTPLLVIIT